MEVLVLLDFESTMRDELSISTGDVIKNVSKATEDGWLHGELKGKQGIFPANFVKEIPIYLIGDSDREPRSIRKPKKTKQVRKCEVTYYYAPQNRDELELVVGETIEILREIEDGWWMGTKNGQVGAFPSNFVTEIFVSPKDVKYSEGKTRPKLSDAMFTKEMTRKASVRNQPKSTLEHCQAMFDYKAQAEDELDLKKGDVIVLLRKETEDEGWWEGELNQQRGFFPDNFVMVIPPVPTLHPGATSQPPARNISENNAESSAMDKIGPGRIRDESKDLRSTPPTKVKLPVFLKPTPPPIKDKPTKSLAKTNGDVAPAPPKPQEEKVSEQFDGLNVTTAKLSHPTANRAKPPQRRPPSALLTAAQTSTNLTEVESTVKKPQSDTAPAPIKVSENLFPTPGKPDFLPKMVLPARPAPPKAGLNNKGAAEKLQEPTLESLQAEIRDLRMSLELLQTRHERDMQEVKEELSEERNKRLALEEEVDLLKLKH